MPKGISEMVRPIVDGRELITVEELAQQTGLTVWTLRERTRENGRGKFIPSRKIGKRLWFDPVDALQAIYDSPKRVVVEAPKTDILLPDMSWL